MQIKVYTTPKLLQMKVFKMLHSEVNSEIAYKIITKHKGKVFVLMQGTESYVIIEKHYFLNEVLKYDINNGLWAKWTLSLHNGFLYIDRIGY
jgi:hypothetical protein